MLQSAVLGNAQPCDGALEEGHKVTGECGPGEKSPQQVAATALRYWWLLHLKI